MKKIFILYFFSIVLLMPRPFFAQENEPLFGKGKWIVNASTKLDFYTQKSKVKTSGTNVTVMVKNKVIMLEAAGGYFFTGFLAGGISMKYVLVQSSLSPATFLGGGFLRFQYPLKTVYPFVELGLYKGYITWSVFDMEKDKFINKKLPLTAFEGTAGIGIPLSRHVSLDPSIKWFVMQSPSSNELYTDKWTEKIIGLYLGFSVYF
ncbi:MAG: hypothetical protein GXO50_01365 [Chlorobi bacterium]|nr:hypothetical protein [Chlorobiota bacterium]